MRLASFSVGILFDQLKVVLDYKVDKKGLIVVVVHFIWRWVSKHLKITEQEMETIKQKLYQTQLIVERNWIMQNKWVLIVFYILHVFYSASWGNNGFWNRLITDLSRRFSTIILHVGIQNLVRSSLQSSSSSDRLNGESGLDHFAHESKLFGCLVLSLGRQPNRQNPPVRFRV